MSKSYVRADQRRSVRKRAGNQCEYCGISENDTFFAHEIEHIIAEKHGGKTILENLALSCALCNKHKGSDLASIDPGTGDLVRLFHPRLESWHNHWVIEPSGRIRPLTAIGTVTANLLQFNRPDRVQERAMLLQTARYAPPQAPA